MQNAYSGRKGCGRRINIEVIGVMKENFGSLPAPRKQEQVRHELFDIIAMTITAVIGNCDNWDKIKDFCISKEAWLRERMGLQLEYSAYFRYTGDGAVKRGM